MGDIEINVIEGYWVAGAFVLAPILVSTGVMVADFLKKGSNGSWVGLLPVVLVSVIFALGRFLAVSRIRISPQSQQATTERGIRPFVSRRTENISGEKRLLICPYRHRSARYIRLDLELPRGRKLPLLRNVTPSKFDAMVEAMKPLGAPLIVVGKTSDLPEWFMSRIGRFGIEREA